MKCQYCEQVATCKCGTCPLKFCDFCIEEHLHAKGIPRRSWNVNKIKIEEIGTEANDHTVFKLRVSKRD